MHLVLIIADSFRIGEDQDRGIMRGQSPGVIAVGGYISGFKVSKTIPIVV